MYIFVATGRNKGAVFIILNKFSKTFINNTEKRTPALQNTILTAISYISIHKNAHKKKNADTSLRSLFEVYEVYMEKKVYVCDIIFGISLTMLI